MFYIYICCMYIYSYIYCIMHMHTSYIKRHPTIYISYTRQPISFYMKLNFSYTFTEIFFSKSVLCASIYSYFCLYSDLGYIMAHVCNSTNSTQLLLTPTVYVLYKRKDAGWRHSHFDLYLFARPCACIFCRLDQKSVNIIMSIQWLLRAYNIKEERITKA